MSKNIPRTKRKVISISDTSSHDYMEMFVKHTPAAVAMFDNNMDYLVASERWYEDYAIKDKNVIGKCHYDVFPEIREKPEWLEDHQRVLKGEQIKCDEDYFIREDGSIEWVKWELRPWYNKNNKIGGLIMFTEVITKQRLAEEKLKDSEKRFQLAVQASLSGVWDWDIKNNRFFGSSRLREILGFSPDSKVSLYIINKCIHKEDLQRVLSARKIYLQHQTKYDEEVRIIRRDDGTQRWVRVRGQALWGKDGKPIRMVGTISDITEQKHAEYKVADYQKQLEDKINERTAELLENNNKLERSIKELTKSNDELERYAYIASHDLREPIRTISACTQLLARKYADKFDKKGKTIVNEILNGSAKLNELVTRLLEYAKLSQSEAIIEDIDLNEIVKNVCGTLKQSITEMQVKIDYNNLPTIKGVKTQWFQLFQNLISNSIKYRSPQRKPVIKICSKDNKITIKDNGIGFDNKYKNYVFEIFNRLHTEQEYPGTGIGLATCKRIVQSHGGEIEAHSTEGKGTEFIIVI